jgi:hypothetical protein
MPASCPSSGSQKAPWGTGPTPMPASVVKVDSVQVMRTLCAIELAYLRATSCRGRTLVLTVICPERP